jgi:hypothetical protein
VLRFFEAKKMNEVGAALGVNEEAAKKRVNRAVEKLRLYFTKRGVVLPAAILTAAISANSVQAAPVALAKTVTAVAMTKGIAASGSTLTLIKGTLKFMAWTKAKTVIVAGVVVLLAAGTITTLIVKHPHQSNPKNPANQTGFNLGDIAPDKTSFIAQMNSIKTTVIPAFIQYAKEHNDDIPKTMADLQPYSRNFSTARFTRFLAASSFTPNAAPTSFIFLSSKKRSTTASRSFSPRPTMSAHFVHETERGFGCICYTKQAANLVIASDCRVMPE